MSRSWLDVVLDPERITQGKRKANKDRERFGAALLLEGRLLDYLREAESGQLPQLGEVREGKVSAPRALLATLGLQFRGDPQAATKYSELAGSDQASSDLRTAAAVLAGIALSDAGNRREAVDLLTQRHSGAESDLERVLLSIHIGTRYAELGDLARAIENTSRAIDLDHKQRRSREYRTALLIVAEHNLWRFQAMRGVIGFAELTPRSTSRILSRFDSSVSQGLESYLNKLFDGSFRDPYTFTISFQSEDPVEGRLLGGLLRAEIFADWDLLTRARKMLGRYRLLAAVGRPERQPESGFHLLRRAADNDGIKGAARLYLKVGPLEPLRQVSETVAMTVWAPSEEPANLTLLMETADVIRPEPAGKALGQLTASLNSRVELSVSSVPWGLVGAIGSLVQVADKASKDTVAGTLLHVALGSPDPALMQDVASVLRLVDWDQVDAGLRSQWVDYVRNYLLAKDDRLFVAQAAAVALSGSNAEGVRDVLAAVYSQEPSLRLGALLVQAGYPLNLEIAAKISEQAVGSLVATRTEAAAGQYSLGSSTDVPAMLAWLLTEVDGLAGWTALLDFLLDRRVAGLHKIRAFDLLASRRDRIPQAERRRLVHELPSFSTAEDRPMFASPEIVTGAALRLAIAVGALDSSQTLAGILALAAEPAAIGRIEAARSLSYAVDERSDDALVTLALTLAQDVHHDVRAAAAHSLTRIGARAGEYLGDLVRERIITLLNEPGVAVPRATLEGLFQAVEQGEQLDQRIIVKVRNLSERHLSVGVRAAATRLLAKLPRE